MGTQLVMRSHNYRNSTLASLNLLVHASSSSLKREYTKKDRKKLGIFGLRSAGPWSEGSSVIETSCIATTAVTASTSPKHVAVIMDGNARWAQERGIPILHGYEAGVEALRRTLKACIERRIWCLTVYALSIENLQRNEDEVRDLFMLIESVLLQYSEELSRAGIHLRVIGDRKKWPASLAQEVARAVKELSHQVRLGMLRPEDITEDMISARLSLTHLTLHRQQPDIVIRTSGEQRLSNFLLWESAYSELYFTDVLWPDFNDDTLEAALIDYSKRTRRYGKGH